MLDLRRVRTGTNRKDRFGEDGRSLPKNGFGIEKIFIFGQMLGEKFLLNGVLRLRYGIHLNSFENSKYESFKKYLFYIMNK